MNKIGIILLATISLTTSGAAHSDQCSGLFKRVNEKTSSASENFIDALKMMLQQTTSTECGSMVSVANKIIYKKRGGGRKLEEDKPFDPAQAQTNLEEALKNSAVQEQLSSARADITDEDTWLYYQATVFDAEGYYPARDLLVNQILQKSK